MADRCGKCGWADLPGHDFNCAPAAGKAAQALVDALPELYGTKEGFGSNHVWIGFSSGDDAEGALIDVSRDGSLYLKRLDLPRMGVQELAELLRVLSAARRSV